MALVLPFHLQRVRGSNAPNSQRQRERECQFQEDVMRETTRSWRFAGLLCAVLVLAGTALAQTDLGQVSGKVLDPKEAIVPDATVALPTFPTPRTPAQRANAHG